MTGKYNVIVTGNSVAYKFDVKRKITILTGDSATGKTTLADLVANHNDQTIVRRYMPDGTLTKSSTKILSVADNGFETILTNSENCILIVDEDLMYRHSKFFELIKASNNYFILISRISPNVIREKLASIPYSMFEIYEIINDTRHRSTNMFRNVYTFQPIGYVCTPIKLSSNAIVITEDSKSGFEFFSKAFPNNLVYPAAGKDNFLKIIKTKQLSIESSESTVYFKGDEHLVFIVDSAGFGSSINRLMLSLRESKFKVDILAPESFEYLLLQAVDTIGRKRLNDILNAPYDYLDVTITDCGPNTMGEDNYYGSWEIYFTNLLVKETRDTMYEYKKGKLNESYLKYIPQVLSNLGLTKLQNKGYFEETSLF